MTSLKILVMNTGKSIIIRVNMLTVTFIPTRLRAFGSNLKSRIRGIIVLFLGSICSNMLMKRHLSLMKAVLIMP